MRKFFKNKKKLLFVCLILMVSLTACSSPRGNDGKTKVNEIIASETFTVKKSYVNTTDVPEEVKEKYADYAEDDEITIEATTFGDAMNTGWFNGLIVWPIAQLINWIAGMTDAGFGIIGTTFLIQLLVFFITIKSQVSSQKMQMIQPEVMKIQNKYAGKTDDRSRMLMAQETQALYKKYNISPFGSILVMFIQLPILMGMYYATMRASSIVVGSFAGIDLSNTPMYGLQHGEYIYLFIFVLMVVFQLLSYKIPQWLQKHEKKKQHIKEKKYAQPKNNGGMMGNMNMMMYMSTGLIAILAFSWPLAMSFYWLVSSVFRVLQNLVVHKFFIAKKKAA